MNKNVNPIIASIGMSASDLCCDVEPVVEAVIGQTTFVVMRYLTSVAHFQAVYVVDMDKMTGVCVVQQEYFQMLVAILADHRIVRGTDELIQAVYAGKVDVSNGADLAKLPQPSQRKVVSDVEKGILKEAKEIRKAIAAERREQCLAALEVKACNSM